MHLQLDRMVAYRQTVDSFLRSGLMNDFAGSVTVRTNPNALFKDNREAVTPRVRTLLEVSHGVIRQLQQLGPKPQRLSCHDASFFPEREEKIVVLNHDAKIH
jgi:hypothetical protein